MRRRRRYSSRDVGKVRERLAVKIAAQLKADGWKARVDASDLWPAQGRWRSDHRMDVMRWEGQVEIDRGWGWRRIGIGSWQTMTELVRAGVNLHIAFNGLDFEVHETGERPRVPTADPERAG